MAIKDKKHARSIADRVYRALLRAYPREFREEYGKEMGLLFRQTYLGDGERTGAFSALNAWLGALSDVIWNAPRQRAAYLWRDLRYAARGLTRTPGHTATAVLTLGLAIGSNTAIFSVIDSVLLNKPPYREPGRLVMLWGNNPALHLGFDEFSTSAPNFLDWRSQSGSFDEMAAFVDRPVTLTGLDNPERLAGIAVSPNLFRLIGTEPELGRSFTDEEEQKGRNHVVVLSHALWQRLGGSREMSERKIQLDDESYTVVGVMPPEFAFPRRDDLVPDFHFFPVQPELWLPLTFSNDELEQRGTFRFGVIARLKPGVSSSQAGADMDVIAERLAEQYPRTNKGFGVTVIPLLEESVRVVRPMLLVLWAAVGFVLLIACVNLANLLLVRAAGRCKEMAIRLALGARGSRLVGQLLTESILVSLLGAGIGTGLAVLGVTAIPRLAPAGVPHLREVQFNGRVLIFTLAVSVLTGIAFGLAPAYRSGRVDVAEELKGTAGSIVATQGRLARALIVIEIAVSVVLLAGSGLMIKGFAGLSRVNPGFDPKGRLVMSTAIPQAWYRDNKRISRFYQQALNRVRGISGVRSVAGSSGLPLAGSLDSASFTILGRPAPSSPSAMLVEDVTITPDYFKTLQIPLLSGRDFSDLDNASAPPVVIINQAMARAYWGDTSPVGERISIAFEQGISREIVGVVGDVKYSASDFTTNPGVFLPQLQVPNELSLVFRTDLEPMALLRAVQAEIKAADGSVPVYDERTMSQLFADSVASARFSTVLLTLFALIALVMSTVGLYGVISSSVSSRRHEIGLRMALGAERAVLLRTVLFQGVGLALIGLAAGAVAALAAGRVIAGLLYGVSPSDPLVFAVIIGTILLVAIGASMLPAIRAARVDPICALRYQ
jgi:putative ABC transport system permease protein